MVILDWWADYPDADNFLYPLFYSGSFGPGGNYAFYSDPVTDSLILRARRTTDDARRTDLYRRIDERVFRAAPWLYLWFPKDLWARRRSEEHTSELQSPCNLVCRLLLEKKKKETMDTVPV